MLPLFWIKVAVLVIVTGTLVSLGPWFGRWVRRKPKPILAEATGCLHHAPHVLMVLHSAGVMLLLLGIDPLPWVGAFGDLAAGHVSAPTAAAGVMLFLIGSVIRVWGLYAQGETLEKNLMIREDHPLVLHGPYTFARHPIYTGNLMAELGLGLSIAYWPLIAFTLLLSVPAWSIRARREEAMLLAHFGERYREYMEKVGRFWPR